MTKRYLFDSNAVSDLSHHRGHFRENARAAKQAGAKIGTCPPVIGELLAGCLTSQSKDRNLRELELGLQVLTVWPFHLAEARIFAKLWAGLRRTGRPMQVVDVQLAAVSLSLGDCTVVTSDSDLLFVPGLRVENWAL